MKNMLIGIYPGSFDPLTFGHLDIIKRSKNICDRLIVAIGRNSAKNSLFSFQERLEMINACCSDLKDFVQAAVFDGLFADFCREQGASVIIRGIRSITDYEYEKPIADLNRRLAPGIETAFLLPDDEVAYISSHMVKEVASCRGDISAMVPKIVSDKLMSRL